MTLSPDFTLDTAPEIVLNGFSRLPGLSSDAATACWLTIAEEVAPAIAFGMPGFDDDLSGAR